MVSSDIVADMLTRIRNGYFSRLFEIQLPYSKLKASILEVMKKEGYISDYFVDGQGSSKLIYVTLLYSRSGVAAIKEIKRVSKPGKRLYTAIKDLKPCYDNMGTYIVSTSKGVLSCREARASNLGGEVICKVF